MSEQTVASYTKLKSGEWGIRVPYPVKKGESVIVTTKAGETKIEAIKNIVWKGNGIWLCAIEQRAKGKRPKRDAAWAERTGNCRACSNDYVDAPHHRAMDGYCGYCAFDEFDI